MGMNLKAGHLKRYGEIARLLWKYGRSDLVKSSGLDQALGPDRLADCPPAEAACLAADLEAMGPAFVKLGQVLSTRADLLPVPFIEALSRLQDHVEPVPFDALADILREDLEKPLARAFASFEQEPLAAASLGQVHRAKLPDGRLVAVKVQRPRAREMVAEDVEVILEIARFLEAHTDLGQRYGLVGLVEEFGRTLVAELDYRQEARNLLRLSENLAAFDRIVVPAPVPEYTTGRVLTMDYVRGRKVLRLAVLRRAEVDGAALADELLRAYLKQFLVDGFFHADPHPGNVFLTEEGHLALLDLGMVAHVTPGMREDLLRWLLAVSDGRAEDATEIALKLGVKRGKDFDEASFRDRFSALIARQASGETETFDFGRTVLEAARAAAESDVQLPREFAMIGKALVCLQQVAAILDPAFDPKAAIRRHSAEIANRQVWKSMSPAHLLKTFMEAKDLVEKLPNRLGRILENLASNRFKIDVDAIDERSLLQGLQKIANRITLGLVLAALIVGGAMLMRVESSFRILGYPGIAVLLFLAAAGGGIALALTIILGDVKSRKRR